MEWNEPDLPVPDDALIWDCIPDAIDQIMDAVVIADAEGRIVYWNKGAEGTLLVPREEAVGRPISDVIKLDAEPDRKSMQDFVARDRLSWDAAACLRRRDGTTLQVYGTHSIIRDPAGNIMGTVAIFRDVRMEEQAKERQREREDRYSQLFNHMTQGVVYQDRQGSIFSMNSSAQHILGLTPDTISRAGPPEALQCCWNEDGIPLRWEDLSALVALRTGQKVTDAVMGFYHPQKEDLCWLKVSSVPLFRPGEERPCQVYTIFDDITEQKRAQDRVETERSRMNTILNSLPVGVGISDREGRLVEVNEMFLQTWGQGPDEEQLLRMAREGHIISPETGQRIGPEELPLAQTIRSGRPERATFNIERPDGTVEAVAVSSAPIAGQDPSVGGYITVVQNINERSRMENELKRRAMQLSRSNDELQQFAYAASHDLQEPLRMIICYLDLLEKKHRGDLNDQAREYLGYARDGAKRMRELIDDLLAYSRVETKGRPRAWIEMDDLVAKVVANLQVSIEESGAGVEKEPLPAIWADEMQMVQLMQNLIGNAIKFRGERPPRIKVRAETFPLEWKFMVQDNGIGIDRKHFGRIFQMFQRLHTRDEYPGTGIGLAICKKIVERHGGRIWAESEVGEGSTFCFTIPRPRPGAP